MIAAFQFLCKLTSRSGRLLTGHAFKHLGLTEPARDPNQFGLFAQEDE